MVFLCAASVLSLNSSLYKLDAWQLKGLGEFHADVVAVGPALVVVSAGRRDASELHLRRFCFPSLPCHSRSLFITALPANTTLTSCALELRGKRRTAARAFFQISSFVFKH